MKSSGTREIAAMIAASLLVAGCGSNPVPMNSDAGRSDAGHVDGRPSDGKASDGAAAQVCPAALPQSGLGCSREGLVCEYGDNPRCLSTATCAQGRWQVVTVKCQAPDPSCPATREAAAGQTCQTQDGHCNYAGLVCECTNCIKYPVERCSGPLTWHCDAPNPDPGCPPARPLLGATCPNEGQYCEYGCEPDVSRQCSGGVWLPASSPYGCPISTRTAKKDIRYLGDDDLARIAKQVQHLRLATYRYRDPAIDKRRHLGFIIEDNPHCLATDLDKRQVDLYSFTSMVLALAQQQQKEIEDLRRQVEVLRYGLQRPATGPR